MIDVEKSFDDLDKKIIYNHNYYTTVIQVMALT